MFQRTLTISGAGAVDGTYIQFIVVDPGTTGDPTANPFTAARGSLNFTNEDFVKQNNQVAGIASRQVIIESTNPDPDTITTSTIEDRIVLSTEYNFGWAQSNADPWVMITQDVQQLDYSSGVNNPTLVMDTGMSLENNSPPLQWHTNSKMRVDQFVDLTEAGQGAGSQNYAYATAVGSYQALSHGGATGAFGTNGPLIPGGTNGGDPGCQVGETSGVDCYDWVAGDELRATWIGQWLEQGSGGSDSLFGFTKYAARHPSTGFLYDTKLTSFADTTAINWGTLDALSGLADWGMGPEPMLVMTPVYVAATDDGGFNPPDPIAATTAAGTGVAGSPSPIDWLDAGYMGSPQSANYIYDRWTVAAGVISAPCPVLAGHTVVCGAVTGSGAGFLQRGVSIDGVEYIQTIVTEDNATGDPTVADFQAGYLPFKDENFIQLGGVNGVAYNLHIADEDLSYLGAGGPLPSTAGQFTYTSRLKSGWAHTGPLDPVNQVDQVLYTPQTGLPAQVSGVYYDFHMLQGETQADKIIYFADAVGVETNSTYGTPSENLGEPVMFATVKLGGAFQNTSHTAGVNDLAGMIGNELLPSLGGTDISWASGEAIQATWVGAQYTTSDPFGYAVVGTTSYTNLSQNGQRVAATDTNQAMPNPDPESWVAPFSDYMTPGYSLAYTPPAF